MRLLVGATAASELTAPQRPALAESYTVAKRWLFEQVHGDHRETLYCRCPFDRDKRVDYAACGYQVADNPQRAARVEVEHVVPASWIGQGRPCWHQRLCVDGSGRSFKGRKCCARIDPAYRAAYNDLHNLWPSVGEVNEQRRNYVLGLVPGEPRAFGRCDFEVDDAAGVAEPRPEIRGDVARIHLYGTGALARNPAGDVAIGAAEVTPKVTLLGRKAGSPGERERLGLRLADTGAGDLVERAPARRTGPRSRA